MRLADVKDGLFRIIRPIVGIPCSYLVDPPEGRYECQLYGTLVPGLYTGAVTPIEVAGAAIHELRLMALTAGGLAPLMGHVCLGSSYAERVADALELVVATVEPLGALQQVVALPAAEAANRVHLLVRRFHETLGLTIGRRPALPARSELEHLLRILKQEVVEAVEAAGWSDDREPSLVALMHELADVEYVIAGIRVACGVTPGPVIEEFARARFINLMTDHNEVADILGVLVAQGYEQPPPPVVRRPEEFCPTCGWLPGATRAVVCADPFHRRFIHGATGANEMLRTAIELTERAQGGPAPRCPLCRGPGLAQGCGDQFHDKFFRERARERAMVADAADERRLGVARQREEISRRVRGDGRP